MAIRLSQQKVQPQITNNTGSAKSAEQANSAESAEQANSAKSAEQAKTGSAQSAKNTVTTEPKAKAFSTTQASSPNGTLGGYRSADDIRAAGSAYASQIESLRGSAMSLTGSARDAVEREIDEIKGKAYREFYQEGQNANNAANRLANELKNKRTELDNAIEVLPRVKDSQAKGIPTTFENGAKGLTGLYADGSSGYTYDAGRATKEQQENLKTLEKELDSLWKEFSAACGSRDAAYEQLGRFF